MNLIYRSIWNDQTGTFVAVSENTSSAGKKVSSCTAGRHARLKLKLLTVSLMMACGASVYAQPVGGVVAAGAASIGGTSGKMTITQTTPNVAINWQSFGIKAGESVQFVQPSSSSVALNRVVGSDPSSILGSLSANGKVFLVNPNGILFGQGASVNVTLPPVCPVPVPEASSVPPALQEETFLPALEVFSETATKVPV